MKYFKMQFFAYVFFVGALTAFFFQEVQHSNIAVGEFELASSTPISAPDTKKLIEKIEAGNSQAKKQVPTTDDMTCTCQFGADAENKISYETAESCGPDRNYFADNIKAFKKVDPKGYYTQPRPYSAANDDILPKKCTTFILRKFFKDRAMTAAEKRSADIEFNKTAPEDQKKDIKDLAEYKNDPSLFAKCGEMPKDGKLKTATSNGREYTYLDTLFTPERYPHKPCVTEEYVSMIHNALIDVADCMGLPAKFMAPKLSNESGMHINTLAPGNDAGLGQFTAPALNEVYNNFDNFKAEYRSGRESCRRIASIPGAIPRDKSEIMPEDAQRCSVISSPPNPLRSFIFYGIFYKAIRAQTESSWKKNGIDDLMKEANIENFDKSVLKQEALVLAYNAGSGPAGILMKEYLNYRLAQIKKFPIRKEDFSMNYWPEKVFGETKAGEERAKVMTNGRPLTYAEYLYAYRNLKYLALVKSQAKLLDKSLGENSCTESKFLEL